MKITKRDVRFFIIGIVTAMLVGFFWDLDNNIKAFKDGFEAGRSDAQVEADE
jgi:hypothetical protein